MPLYKTPGITINSRKWGEADRIVTFYTIRFGKLRAVARGARRIRSRFGAALEPFVFCDLNLFEKQGDSLYRVTQVDIREAFTTLREDLALMSGAARLVNLVSAVTVENDPSPRIFETLLEGLRSLQGNGDSALITWLYQIRLLGNSGFRPQIDHCASCGARSGLETAGFLPKAGGLVCPPCADRFPERCLAMSPGTWAFFKQASYMPPANLSRLKAAGQVRRELERAVESFVGFIAGTRLPSSDFLAAEGREPVYHPSR